MAKEDARQQMELAFWQLLKSRHPVTYWWWTDDTPPTEDLFPSWTEEARDREIQEWRRLAGATSSVDDKECVHWGRFARDAAARLGQNWPVNVAQPLRHANLVLTAAELLDPGEARHARTELLARLAQWLTSLSSAAHDFWAMAWAEAEGRRLSRLIERPGPNHCWARPEWHLARNQAQQALQAYLARWRASASAWREPMPWIPTAHVSVEAWREERQRLKAARPLIGVPLPESRQSEPEGGLIAEERVVPGLAQWWLKPGAQGAILFRGDLREPARSLGRVMAFWRQKSALSRLTWALTPPPIIVGGLMAASLRAEEERAFLDPGHLAQWRQAARVLACADAWLWLEGAEPSDVFRWLKRFLSQSEAQHWVPWLRSHPGFYVMAHRVAMVAREEMGAADGRPWLWENGPIMPPRLYTTPEALLAGTVSESSEK
ncbi:MAG: hypothetical protein OWU84_11330 [Firmicutes bacterium]|nr:hypothetical protein [Bacillota bacterium]